MELIERRPELLSTTHPSVWLLGVRSAALMYSGHFDEAEELSARALEAARAAGWTEDEGFQTGNRALIRLARGHLQDALRQARRALEIAETLTSQMFRVHARLYCDHVGSFLALWPDTERWGQEGIEIVHAHHVATEIEPFLLTFRGEGLAARIERGRAHELIGEALAKAQSLKSRFLEFRARLGEVRLLRWTSASVHAEAIEAALRTAEHLARAIGLAAWLPWVYEERAALALALGDREKQRAHLEEARRLYEQIGAAGHLERLAKEMGA